MVHSEPLQRTSPLPLSRDHAMAADGFFSLQCWFRGARATAHPPLSVPRSASTAAPLPDSGRDDGGQREPLPLVTTRVTSLGRKRMEEADHAGQSAGLALLATGNGIARAALHESSGQALHSRGPTPSTWFLSPHPR